MISSVVNMANVDQDESSPLLLHQQPIAKVATPPPEYSPYPQESAPGNLHSASIFKVVLLRMRVLVNSALSRM
jgi:hypothetical protein